MHDLEFGKHRRCTFGCSSSSSPPPSPSIATTPSDLDEHTGRPLVARKAKRGTAKGQRKREQASTRARRHRSRATRRRNPRPHHHAHLREDGGLAPAVAAPAGGPADHGQFLASPLSLLSLFPPPPCDGHARLAHMYTHTHTYVHPDPHAYAPS